jgi:xylan 1,4-beta-xylosidase
MIVVAETPVAALSPAWRRCVGTGRMGLSLRTGHARALDVAQREIGFELVRGHGMFADDMGVHRTDEVAGERHVRHAFGYLDQVVDGYLRAGLRPFLELGFMPSGLASGDQTVFWWKGNVTPPRSYPEWARLVTLTLRHLVERHGLDEVRTWPIEVWNEPNLDTFWQGADQAEYLRLYEVTARAVKDVDAQLQVGGPSLAPGGDSWWAPFADSVATRDVPVDFVSAHAYSSGPAQHVPFGVYQDLRPAQWLLDQFAAPTAHLRDTALAGLPVHMTEFNTSYRPDNPVHDTAYNAAYLAPVLAAGGDLVDSFSYWTVSDVFEEANVPTAIFHGGFGLLAHREIRKPTFHLYAFMARLGDQVLARGADHLVTRHDDGRVAVLAWNPVDGGQESHELQLSIPVPDGGSGHRGDGGFGGPSGPDGMVSVLRRSVDEEAGNAWTAWREMGRPADPTSTQLDVLHACSEPSVRHHTAPVVGGRADLRLTLGRNEVTVVELAPVRDETPSWIDDTRIPGYAGERR